MNKVFTIIVFWCCAVLSFGQNNLVQNPGFDSISQCPYSGGQIHFAYNWFQPNKQFSTSDILSKCSISNSFGVPGNVFGYQTPVFDSTYSGIILYAPAYNWTKNYREYIQTRLITPLKQNYTYCIEFYVSLSDSSNIAISSIGCLFSPDSILLNSSIDGLISANPNFQNEYSNIILDKQNWVKVSGSFSANGGEEFLTIGNFFNDSLTFLNSQLVSNYHNNCICEAKNISYYYIDNVRVYACDSPAVSITDSSFVLVSNVFSPNQDGVNDVWQVTANQVLQLSVQVFNRWGEEVYVFNSSALGGQQDTTLSMTYNPAWDGFTKSGLPVSDGTYFYVISYTLPNGETKVEKGTLTLIR